MFQSQVRFDHVHERLCAKLYALPHLHTQQPPTSRLLTHMADDEEDDFDDSVTRCLCGNNDLQDGFMIKCDRCNVWQHGDCMDVPEENVRACASHRVCILPFYMSAFFFMAFCCCLFFAILRVCVWSNIWCWMPLSTPPQVPDVYLCERCDPRAHAARLAAVGETTEVHCGFFHIPSHRF